MDDAREPASTPEAPAVNSVWADLRRQHAEVAGDVDPCYLPIETYTGVVARYRYVPLDDTKAATNRQVRVKDLTDLSRIAAIDMLVLALEELCVVAPDGDIPRGKDGRELYPHPLKPLGNVGEPPMRFDERLASSMGFPEGLTASQIVRHFFAQDDRTIMDHAGRLGEWTSTARRAVAEDLAGG